MKRTFDIVLALLLFPLAFVFCLFLAPMIALDTRASPIFAQQRIGRDRRSFTLLKLRTMPKEAPNVASHRLNGNLVTPFGAFIRKFKLDELPQIWNVLVGQMSFVGPRPCLGSQLELIAERSHRGVFDIRPGITGLSQVAGVDMSEPKRLAELDHEYVTRHSVRLDIGLIIQTVLGEGRGDAASTDRRN